MYRGLNALTQKCDAITHPRTSFLEPPFKMFRFQLLKLSSCSHWSNSPFSHPAERPPDAQYHQLCISFPGGIPHWEQKAQTIDKQRKQARNEQLITLTQIQDHRTLPRVEMELVLTGKKIEFSPSCAEVTDIQNVPLHQANLFTNALKVADMIISVVHEMNKLLREVLLLPNENKHMWQIKHFVSKGANNPVLADWLK